jgi:hypothetical protein
MKLPSAGGHSTHQEVKAYAQARDQQPAEEDLGLVMTSVDMPEIDTLTDKQVCTRWGVDSLYLLALMNSQEVTPIGREGDSYVFDRQAIEAREVEVYGSVRAGS